MNGAIEINGEIHEGAWPERWGVALLMREAWPVRKGAWPTDQCQYPRKGGVACGKGVWSRGVGVANGGWERPVEVGVVYGVGVAYGGWWAWPDLGVQLGQLLLIQVGLLVDSGLIAELGGGGEGPH